MPISDAQLRQELQSFNEMVPPITQDNRDKLHNRLLFLKSSTAQASSSRQSRSGNMNSSTSSNAVRGGSTQYTPQMSSLATANKPSHSRGLIELSDSEGEGPPSEQLLSRGAGAPSVQVRSIQVRRPGAGEFPNPFSSTSTINAVEQSVARHRREIQNLIDSARERTLAVNTNLSNVSGAAGSTPSTTPIRVGPPSTTAGRLSQPTKTPSSTTMNQAKRPMKAKGPSWFTRMGTKLQSFWKQYKHVIKTIAKALLIGTILGVALIYGYSRVPDLKELIPHRRGITCNAENATYCPEMEPLIRAVRTQLQTRTGEVDCGFRPQTDLLVTKPEINKYLTDRGFKFEEGDAARWETLITYIVEKPVDDIVVYDKRGHETNDTQLAFKLSTYEAIRSLMCRTRKGVHSAFQNLVWLLGGIGSFLGLGWYIRRRVKKHQEDEDTYHDLIQEITDMLEEQYEASQSDPKKEAKPYLAISHVHDALVDRKDRERYKKVWERARKHIAEQESRVRTETQLIHGEEFEVWRWIQPKSAASPTVRKQRSRSPSPNAPFQPDMSGDTSVLYTSNEGLTECLKLRNFFREDNGADDDEIDQAVNNIQQRCSHIRRIEHIGIHATYVYLKFSSKEAAAQGYQALNGWNYLGREIVAKYLRVSRYYEHFPEAAANGNQSSSSSH